MVRRIITIPLCVILTIAVFTLNSFCIEGLPDPVLTFSCVYNGVQHSQIVQPFVYNQAAYYYVTPYLNGSSVSSSSTFFTASFNVDLTDLLSFDLDIYIRSSDFSGGRYDLGSLLDFPYTTSSQSIQCTQYSYNFHLDDNSFELSNTKSITENAVVFHFDNIPGDSYSFICKDRSYAIVGLFVDDFIYQQPDPEPDPDPDPEPDPEPDPDPEPLPPSVLLSDLGSVVSSGLSWVSQSVATIVDHPFLLLTVGFFCLGAAISFLGRLISRE